METTKTEYVVQRFVHNRCGEDRWTGYSYEADVGGLLTRDFKDNPVNERIAEKVLLKLSCVRTSESFRLVKRTIITQDEIGLLVGPRKPLTVDDLKKIAESPPDHDGVRVFNGLYSVIKDVGLDPDNFGALPSALVLRAISTLSNPLDEWVLVHPESFSGYEDWDKHRVWWNLALRSKIKIDDWGVGNDKRYWYERIAYGDHTKKSKRYRTFAGAITESENDIGTVSTLLKIPVTMEI